jgi:class 3 adenylate cyclase
VGFASLAQRLTPALLVELLDLLFSRLDELAERHGLERIRTIGDTYLVAAGVAGAAHRGIADLAAFALDAQTAASDMSRKYAVPIQLRIGLAAGPVICGVVGRHRPYFDLWGETVNLAEQLESSGLAGAIQVDESTYQLLVPSFAFKSRGLVGLKGIGPVRTFLLQGCLDEAACPGEHPADRPATPRLVMTGV